MKLFGALLLVLGAGCGQIEAFSIFVDDKAFSILGRTLIAEPGEVSLKEIHLDTGSLRGREVVVEGALLEVGEFATFAVIGDDIARMLVNFTGVLSAKGLIGLPQKRVHLRVLGTVTGGQRGLPVVVARAFTVIE